MNCNERILKPSKQCKDLLKEVFYALCIGQTIYAQGLFVSMLHLLLSTSHPKQNTDYVATQALDFIHQNIDSTITLEQLCAHCGVSLSGLKHKFREYTGDTPRNYINRMKVEKAKQLLSCNLSITDTAMHLSFNSSDYFSVLFKKYTRMTPGEYKRRAKNTK